jgi:molybdate transport repressor ModE-like protein
MPSPARGPRPLRSCDEREPAGAQRLTPRLKVWLERDGEYAFGYGLCQILQAVNRTGSIKHAAASLGKSYRHIWGRIKAAERILGTRLVQTHVGGKDAQRSGLTEEAAHLLGRFLAVRARLLSMLSDEFGR